MVSATLRDILTPGVIGVPESASVATALSSMREARISSVVALSRRRPVGILTERGVIGAMAAHGQALFRFKVREIMSSPVLTAREDMLIHEAFTMLMEKNIRHLVVVDAKGRALGMVTQTNMVQNLGVEYFVEVKRAGQIMARGVATLTPGESLRAALELMVRGPFSCVVAARSSEPLGIVSERDMVRLLSQGADLDATPLERVMSRPVAAIAEDTPVHQAAAIMREKRIRRLVVLNREGLFSGILTQSDIVKGMEARYVEMLKEVIREKDHLLRQAVNEAARKTHYLDTILNASPDMGVAATDGEAIAFMNQAARNILPAAGAAIGRTVEEFHQGMGVSPARIRRALAIVRKGRQHRFAAAVPAEGSERYLDCRLSAIPGVEAKPGGYVLIVRDVTERRRAEETIKRMAYHDALTSLPNRFLVSDRLEQGLVQARRKGTLLAVMVLDLDGFKEVNDTLGHNAGDALLKQVAASVREVLRKSDTVGRMGGDEFLVVLPDVKTPEGVAAVAAKMLKSVAGPRSLAGREVRITTSIGVALFPFDGQDAQALIQKADGAMYAAKQAGRDTYRFAGGQAGPCVLNLP
jgi:diguanylate cyclase (GGDEF)-like protein/PAS domain S-box-containing protein